MVVSGGSMFGSGKSAHREQVALRIREGEILGSGSETTRPAEWDDNGEAFSDECELTL